MVKCTLPYSKEYQNGGRARSEAFLPEACAVGEVEDEGKAVGIVAPKRIRMSVKLRWPSGQRRERAGISPQVASWLPGDAMYGLRELMGESWS